MSATAHELPQSNPSQALARVSVTSGNLAKPQIDALTGIRSVGALLVVICHVQMIMFLGALPPKNPQDQIVPAFREWNAQGAADLTSNFFLSTTIHGGYAAVNLFFMLSGFVLAYTCLQENGRFRVSPRGFWMSRFARIYPVYLFGLIFYLPLFFVTATMGGMSTGKWWAMIAATLGLAQAWWPEAANAWNPPAWTLSAEAFFYVVFPFLLTWVDRRTRPQIWTLFAICYAWAVVPAVLYVLINPDGLTTMTYIEEGTWWRVMKYNPLVRFPEFFSGVLMGKLFAYDAMQNARTGRSSQGWLAIVALVAVFIGMSLTDYLPYIVLHNGLLMPLVAVAVYDLAMGGGPLGWFFSRRPLVALGNSTYCIYILHAAFIGYGMIATWFALGGKAIIEHDEAVKAAADPSTLPPVDFSKFSTEMVGTPWQFLIWLTIIVIVASLAMNRWFEEPCRRYLRRKLTHAHVPIPPRAQAADVP
jgi:peptidoglycan/LPS O-acetylase OafA/YrhL